MAFSAARASTPAARRLAPAGRLHVLGAVAVLSRLLTTALADNVSERKQAARSIAVHDSRPSTEADKTYKADNVSERKQAARSIAVHDSRPSTEADKTYKAYNVSERKQAARSIAVHDSRPSTEADKTYKADHDPDRTPAALIAVDVVPPEFSDVNFISDFNVVKLLYGKAFDKTGQHGSLTVDGYVDRRSAVWKAVVRIRWKSVDTSSLTIVGSKSLKLSEVPTLLDVIEQFRNMLSESLVKTLPEHSGLSKEERDEIVPIIKETIDLIDTKELDEPSPIQGDKAISHNLVDDEVTMKRQIAEDLSRAPGDVQTAIRSVGVGIEKLTDSTVTVLAKKIMPDRNASKSQRSRKKPRKARPNVEQEEREHM